MNSLTQNLALTFNFKFKKKFKLRFDMKGEFIYRNCKPTKYSGRDISFFLQVKLWLLTSNETLNFSPSFDENLFQFFYYVTIIKTEFFLLHISFFATLFVTNTAL